MAIPGSRSGHRGAARPTSPARCAPTLSPRERAERVEKVSFSAFGGGEGRGEVGGARPPLSEHPSVRPRPVIRPATAADLIAFYGRPPPASVRALVAILDGRPVGVGGLKYEGGADGETLLVAFSDLRPELRAYPVAIMRAARRVVASMQGRPAIALADPAEPGAPAFLARLGFVHAASTAAGEIYRLATAADDPASTPDSEVSHDPSTDA